MNRPTVTVRSMVEDLLAMAQQQHPDVSRLAIKVAYIQNEQNKYIVNITTAAGVVPFTDESQVDVMGVVEREVAKITERERNKPNVGELDIASNTTINLYTKFRRIFGPRPIITVKLGYLDPLNPSVNRLTVELDYTY
ncbi:hypothetical protein AH06_137 [Erwinia phage AH06]|nr:hypothetical protein AH06_137 [Erwinia phage AH06]